MLGGLESLFGVPVIETYGMTEAASQIAANPLGRRKPGSVGQSAGAEIAIMDREGRRLPAGERGEIALRGPTITQGYDNDAAATKSAFRDGWFRTGDLGYLDRDGYLFIVGRIKDVINRGGQQGRARRSRRGVAWPPAMWSKPPLSPSPIGDLARTLPPLSSCVRTPRSAHAEAPRLRPRTPGRVQGPWPDPDRAGDPERSERKDQAQRTGRRAFNHAANGASVNAAARWFRPARNWSGNWPRPGRTSWNSIRSSVDQDVFALGADSLTVTQMLSRLRARFGVDFSFKDIFDAPTVAALAARIEVIGKDPAAASLSLRDTPADARSVRLSFQQHKIHVLSRLDPTGYNYHVLEVARLSGPLDLDALEASIATICERHEVLRSTFLETPWANRCKPWERLGRGSNASTCDRAPGAGERRRSNARRRESLRQPFDLDKGAAAASPAAAARTRTTMRW